MTKSVFSNQGRVHWLHQWVGENGIKFVNTIDGGVSSAFPIPVFQLDEMLKAYEGHVLSQLEDRDLSLELGEGLQLSDEMKAALQAMILTATQKLQLAARKEAINVLVTMGNDPQNNLFALAASMLMNQWDDVKQAFTAKQEVKPT